MDEDTMNFYHYNLNIFPSGIVYALSYVKSILLIFTKNNTECKELARSLKRLRLIKKNDFIERNPKEIVMEYES